MRIAGPPRSPHPGICHVFYETRVLLGREFTLQRFCREILQGEVEAVMLGYIEKGQRLPSESLVRRLAAFRKEAPDELLALLARDRILRTVGKELRQFLGLKRDARGVEDAQLAVLVTQALTGLPDDARWVDLAAWRDGVRDHALKKGGTKKSQDAQLTQVERALARQGLIEIKAKKIRRRGHHYEPQQSKERLALAIEYSVLFLKGLIDRVAFPDEDRGTYLRNHYLHIHPSKIGALQKELDATLRTLARKYGVAESDETEFLNILTTATHL